MIKLDLRTDLAKVTPETIGPVGTCSYTAPCAVGAMMTEEQRNSLRKQQLDSANIFHLVYANIVEVPEDQLEDFRSLQRSFDNCNSPTHFFEVLDELKEEYS